MNHRTMMTALRRLCRPHSPTVAEELAQVCPDYESAQIAAMRRASVVGMGAANIRYNFEDGSALEFNHESYVVFIH